jgi:hypothetical protein
MQLWKRGQPKCHKQIGIPQSDLMAISFYDFLKNALKFWPLETTCIWKLFQLDFLKKTYTKN